jgi:hypothetical protein
LCYKVNFIFTDDQQGNHPAHLYTVFYSFSTWETGWRRDRYDRWGGKDRLLCRIR